MNEHFINARVIGGGKQTAIHPARSQSARHAIDGSGAGSVRFMGCVWGPCGAAGPRSALEAGAGDGHAPAPRPRPHNAPLFGAGRV